MELFSIAAPGLEGVVAREQREMGIECAVEAGGVAWRGDAARLYSAALRLRTASRILLRVATFRARTFFELERHAAKVEWGQFVGGGRPAVLRVTSRKSRLYHQRAIEERISRAVQAATGTAVVTATGGEEEDEGGSNAAGEQLFVIRFVRDVCTVSVDACGALLHRRGYRQALGRAPLRETVAAAMLMEGGWRGQAPLLDPFCGSGTIPIEGALLARGIVPGLARASREPRDFAFRHWARFEPGVWDREVSRATGEIRDRVGSVVRGSDRDEGVVEAARANAARAGVAEDVRFEVQTASTATPPGPSGWIVTNPPYGVRARGGRDLRDLYAAFGARLEAEFGGWTVVLLTAEEAHERQLGLPLRELLRTRNGGIPVRLLTNGARG
jgi:putative N6-adenine-specific DNA methylase